MKKKSLVNVTPLAAAPGCQQLAHHTPPVKLNLFALLKLLDISHLFALTLSLCLSSCNSRILQIIFPPSLPHLSYSCWGYGVTLKRITHMHYTVCSSALWLTFEFEIELCLFDFVEWFVFY